MLVDNRPFVNQLSTAWYGIQIAIWAKSKSYFLLCCFVRTVLGAPLIFLQELIFFGKIIFECFWPLAKILTELGERYIQSHTVKNRSNIVSDLDVISGGWQLVDKWSVVNQHPQLQMDLSPSSEGVRWQSRALNIPPHTLFCGRNISRTAKCTRKVLDARLTNYKIFAALMVESAPSSVDEL